MYFADSRATRAVAAGSPSDGDRAPVLRAAPPDDASRRDELRRFIADLRVIAPLIAAAPKTE
jgi:hypothetical protein